MDQQPMAKRPYLARNSNSPMWVCPAMEAIIKSQDLGSYACIASSSAETMLEAGAESACKQKKASSFK